MYYVQPEPHIMFNSGHAIRVNKREWFTLKMGLQTHELEMSTQAHGVDEQPILGATFQLSSWCWFEKGQFNSIKDGPSDKWLW